VFLPWNDFTVSYDMIGAAHVADLDANNSGGLKFTVTKLIPEPNVPILMMISGSGLSFFGGTS